MLTYYKKSFIDLLNRMHKIKNNPFGHIEEFLEIQEVLIKRITYIEHRVRKNHSQIKSLKSLLSTRESHIDKHEAHEIKGTIDILHKQIDSYQDLLILFRWIGDALAFSLIDRWDIKPLGLKQESPGFISGKKGAKRERQIFRNIPKKTDSLVLLNDLTNCLRHGDITLFSPRGKFIILEVKSKKQEGARQLRQAEKIRNVSEYLTHDFTNRLYGTEGQITRVATTSKGVFYIAEINRVLQQALATGQSYSQVEEGLFYFSILNPTLEKMKNIFDSISTNCTGEIIVSQVDIKSYGSLAYYPLALSILDANNLFLLCMGDVILGVLTDIGTMRKKIESSGYKVNFTQTDKDPVIFIENPNIPDDTFSKIGIGNHFFNRIFTEFMSVDWLIKETLAWKDRTKDFDKIFPANPQ